MDSITSSPCCSETSFPWISAESVAWWVRSSATFGWSSTTFGCGSATFGCGSVTFVCGSGAPLDGDWSMGVGVGNLGGVTAPWKLESTPGGRFWRTGGRFVLTVRRACWKISPLPPWGAAITPWRSRSRTIICCWFLSSCLASSTLEVHRVALSPSKVLTSAFSSSSTFSKLGSPDPTMEEMRVVSRCLSWSFSLVALLRRSPYTTISRLHWSSAAFSLLSRETFSLCASCCLLASLPLAF